MGIYECDFVINFDDIDINYKLSELGLLNFLVNSAGMHSDSVRIWTKRYS